MPRPRLAPITALLLAATFAAGCGDRAAEKQAPRTTVSVSAAASLREAFTAAEKEYEAAHPDIDIRVNFGASGALQRQIEQGAPVDVFASAAEKPMDALESRGLIDPRSRRRLAGNELVLIVPTVANSAGVRGFADLSLPRVRRVALGVPASVPAGEYADQVLRTLGIRDSVQKKAVLGQDVRAVLAYVASGEADAGVVYRTDVAAAGNRVRIVASAPAGSHSPITYPIAVTTQAADAAAARAFAGFLLGPRGREILRAHGFVAE
ncbi:molybdate ABC transporter substrate-binding protein [Longimicrobium terrae]|uniref:Molybdate transport system substrate-binding protein n=1 Tax=Longimicrobium terrae TaxID=1639882 RepID=A0A841H3M5_9BACT|nr:molybdate ABC transporter substrate-binding protein [Longimicrobium terrae]MBB4638328.1 molybdate transport system substrate-binding protein [Longimicrobium terrae]MBB6072604.1 molybdate transport system substrate-binding protein [Longimicrobium terrae]NNC28617.1 molybdate ABC transporter substrate-binding protein [Longimicrobium terrae]